jgi:hypothetical protein
VLLLLVDQLLQELPFEGLDALGRYKGRVFRDYSVHMLGHRQKSSSAGAGAVKASAVRAVIDTYHEDTRAADPSFKSVPMTDLFAQMTESGSKGPLIAPKAGDKWRGLSVGGASGISLQDWISATSGAASDGTVLYVHCPGKLASIWSPNDISLMNLENISLAVVLDNGFNDLSYRRQNVVDNKKSQLELVNDDSFRISALLSLCGARSVVSTLWSTSFSSQVLFTTNFWNKFTADKNTLIDAVITGTNSTKVPLQEELSKSGSKSPSKNPTPNQSVLNDSIKLWIKMSKAMYGLHSITYEAS